MQSLRHQRISRPMRLTQEVRICESREPLTDIRGRHEKTLFVKRAMLGDTAWPATKGVLRTDATFVQTCLGNLRELTPNDFDIQERNGVECVLKVSDEMTKNHRENQENQEEGVDDGNWYASMSSCSV